MDITLHKASLEDAIIILDMQEKAFARLLEKYQDFETNPGNETLERITERMKQPYTVYYLIKNNDLLVGAIRIISKPNQVYRISPIFILPEHQGKGISQKVFHLIEKVYDKAFKWELDTILQEEKHCYLYEKLGYKKTGVTKVINERMTIVFYEKVTMNDE